MIPYIVTFILSSMIFYFAQSVKAKSCILFWGLSILSVSLLSLLAGVRDITVGTDVLFYEVGTFSICRYVNSVFDFILYRQDMELFFVVINYLSALISDSIVLPLFLIHFIPFFIFFVTAERYSDFIPLWILMISYIFLFFNPTLNLMRQGIAISFMCYVFKFVEQRRLKALLLSAGIAFFIHRSSLVVSFVFLYLYLVSLLSEKTQIKFLIVSILGLVGVFFVFGHLIETLAQIESMAKYAAYGTNSSFKSGINTLGLSIRFLFVFLVVFFRKSNGLSISQNNILLILLAVDVFCLFLGLYTYFTSRLAMYFMAIELPYIFMLLKGVNVSNRSSKLFQLSLVFVFAFYFYWINIHKGENATYPYTSKILGIE